MKWDTGQHILATCARVTFSESWFYHNYGLTFGEKYCLDPIFRTEQDREAMRLLYDRFGQYGIGEADPPPSPHLEICGHRFLPALLGCEIVYQNDQSPATRHMSVALGEKLAAFTKPDLETDRWAVEFRRQAEVLVDRYGFVDSRINGGGPINVASNVMGTDAFLHVADAAPEFRDFLMMIAELCVDTYDALTRPYSTDPNGGRELFIGNCPVYMIDPRSYESIILPCDRYVRDHAARFGLHHCGIMDRYLAIYKTLEPLDYIEAGFGSNLSAVREAFPTTPVSVLFHVWDIGGMTAGQMRDTVAEMVQQVSPKHYIRSMWMPDVDPNVPDEVIGNFVEAVNSAFGLRDERLLAGEIKQPAAHS